ncbi:MAG: biotin/lipoyl-binding protein [Candidatus Heimdallarchaeota archaeon]|nr:biotin/lipoyl-binding protein [Candidatus Heimdallarchaeota archaeon]
MTIVNTKFRDKEIKADVSQNTILLDDKEYIIHKGTTMQIQLGEQSYEVHDVVQLGKGLIRVELEAYTLDIKVENPFDVALSTTESGDVESPMAGVVSSILHKPGDIVKKGDTLLIISAMKMENKIQTPVNGKIKSINVKLNEQVNANQLLAEIKVAS